MTQPFVYFLRPVNALGPIKIGCSVRPLTRLQIFAAWSPVELVLMGTVAGELKDEAFLHRCFADCHSHGEWFLAKPHLLETITALLAAGNFDAARRALKPVGSIRKKRAPISPEEGRRRSYFSRVRWAGKRLRKALGEDGPWYAPEDVQRVTRKYREIVPTAEDYALLDEYLADPAARSVVPDWRKKAVAA